MTTGFRRRTPLLLAALAAVGLIGQAQAAVPQAYAYAYDNVYNGLIVPNVLTSFSPGTPVPSTGSNAALNGSGPNFASPSDNVPVALCPPNAACGAGGSFPGATPTDNAFLPFGQAASNGFKYGWGDAQIPAEQAINPTPPPVFTPFQAVNAGEASVTAGNSAAGGGLVGSATTFTATPGLVLTITFNALPYSQEFLTAGGSGATDQATAALSASATIIDVTTGGNTVFNFAPDGTTGAITGGISVLDPFSLNYTASLTGPGGGSTAQNPCLVAAPPGGAAKGAGAPAPGACGVANTFEAQTTYAFNSTDTYSIRLGASESTLVVKSVPEPASMALLGLGLVALGLVRRRKGGSLMT